MAKPDVNELGVNFVNLYTTPRYVMIADGWYRYDENFGWVACSGKSVESDVVYFLGSHGVSATNSTVSGVMGVVRGLAYLHHLPSPTCWLNDSGRLSAISAWDWLSCENVHINLVTGETRPRDSSLFTLGRLPCRYEPEADCPRWKSFIHEVLRQEDVEAFQMMFGLSLSFHRRWNVFFIVHGAGGTGKSTALNVLQTLNAGNVCSVSLSAMGERFLNYPLTEKRLNLVSDMDSIFENGRVSLLEGALKSSTCGESIQVERKNCHPVTRPLVALNVFATNTFPRFRDRSNAILDRMRVFRFDNVFRNTNRQDPDLQLLLLSELTGILNWSLEGYRKLLACRTFPESHPSALWKREKIQESRPEELFFQECLSPSPERLEPSHGIYLRYQTWSRENGYYPLCERDFSIRLLESFPGVTKARKGKDRKMAYLGLKLEE